MDAPPPDPAEFERLLDDFQRRLRAGDAPSADDYAARHPHLADRIREVFPVIASLEAAHAGPPPAHPARLGDYRILREVGRGGMGIVYEAVQESLKRHVAVKVIPRLLAGRPDLRERFARESEAAGRLHHTNIVPVFGVGHDQGLSYFAMQFIRGAGLDRVLDAVRAARGPSDRTPAGRADPTAPGLAPAAPAGPPPAVLVGQTGAAYFRTAAGLMRQAADALHHAHTHRVQHRDVKPSNLLVDDAGVLWVTDFGLAKLDDGSDLTASGDHLGTLRYAPPERFSGDADARADLYSLGATFYELLTLRAAFPEPNPLRLIDQIKTAAPPDPRTVNPLVPRDLNTVCLKCLEKDPSRRYPTAAALAADLQAFLDGRPVTARRVGPLEAAVRWGRRRPVAATVLTALAVMVLGAAGLLLEREEARHAARAEALLRTVRTADTAELAPVLADLREYRRRLRPALLDLAARPITDRGGLHARLALLGDDPQHAADVAAHLLDCAADRVAAVRGLAGPHLGPHRERFWEALADPLAPPPVRVRAAGVLAGLAPDDPRWDAHAGPLADLLVAIDPVELGHHARTVGPVLPRLADALVARYDREQRGLLLAERAAPAELAARVGRLNAAAVLLWQTTDDRPAAAAWLLAAADDAHLAAVLGAARRRWDEFRPLLRAALPDPAPDPETARRRAGAAAVLLAVGGDPLDPAWHLFRHAPDPTARSHLVRRCRPAGVPAARLVERFRTETDVTARRALLLALGEYPADALPAGFTTEVARRYAGDPDPGLHAAAGWALRHRWGLAARADAADAVGPVGPVAGRGWFRTPEAGTFCVVEAPGHTRTGTPGADADPDLRDERPAVVRVPRRFAIAAREVTAGEFETWRGKAAPGDPELPAGRVSWFEACQFCNWLSERAGLPPDQWCYEANDAGKFHDGMRPAPDHLSRAGYRLPTEAEWEFATRAGCAGPRFFGAADGLLGRYAWVSGNAGDRAHPVGRLLPNDRGLFDVLGNVQEWAEDFYHDPPPAGPRLDLGLVGRVDAADNRVLRGGAFNLPEGRVRCGYRFNLVPKNAPGSCGLRLARTLPGG